MLCRWAAHFSVKWTWHPSFSSSFHISVQDPRSRDSCLGSVCKSSTSFCSHAKSSTKISGPSIQDLSVDTEQGAGKALPRELASKSLFLCFPKPKYISIGFIHSDLQILFSPPNFQMIFHWRFSKTFKPTLPQIPQHDYYAKWSNCSKTRYL